MIAAERHHTILDLLIDAGSVSVADLVERFDVSEMTVRRDLEELERKGLLRRVHGGAVSNRGRSYEPPFMRRSAEHQAEKERIGAAAAALVRNGDSIALDVGTTTLAVARHLADRRDLTVLTPSFPAASLLANRPGIRLILTGGILRSGEHSLVGRLAERAVQEFYIDKLFLGVGSIDCDAGLTEFNLEDALVKRAMLRSAKETIVVADASKFGQVAFAVVAPVNVVNCVVTDTSIDPDIQQRLETMGIEFVLA